MIVGRVTTSLPLLATAFALAACARTGATSASPSSDGSYDVVLRGGTVYDGSGRTPFTGDVAIRGDRIVAIDTGGRRHLTAAREIDAQGMAVAPGFINLMSGHDPLFVDGRAQSDIRQGVTLEVFGEGSSMGPLSDSMKVLERTGQGDILARSHGDRSIRVCHVGVHP